MMPDLTYCSDAYDAAEGADAVVIVTEWDAFRALDLTRLKALMVAPVLVDLRNVYRREEVEAAASPIPPSGAERQASAGASQSGISASPRASTRRCSIMRRGRDRSPACDRPAPPTARRPGAG